MEQRVEAEDRSERYKLGTGAAAPSSELYGERGAGGRRLFPARSLRMIAYYRWQAMKNFLLILLASTLPLAAQNTIGNQPVNPKTAEAVHNSAIVIDTHADTTQRLVDENYDLADPLNGGNLNLDSAKKGNLGAEFFSIWVEPELY